MTMTLVMILALALLALAGVGGLLAMPTRGALGASSSAALPSGQALLPAAIRAQYASFLPGSEAVLGAPPAVPVAPFLSALPPVSPPAVDLAALGIADERDVTDGELWRAWRARAKARAGRPS